MIQTLTINVTIPDGYEATGEYRGPSIGEWFLTMAGNACQCLSHHQSVETRIILRKIWALPDWFQPDWILEQKFSGYYVSRRSATIAYYYNAPTLWTLYDDVFIAPPAGTQLPICKK